MMTNEGSMFKRIDCCLQNQSLCALIPTVSMSAFEQFTDQFIRGLRGVPRYMDSVCESCKGSCGERPDDQCLISAWSSYIQGAFDHGYDPEETGRRCALAQLQQREMDGKVRMPCETNAGK